MSKFPSKFEVSVIFVSIFGQQSDCRQDCRACASLAFISRSIQVDRDVRYTHTGVTKKMNRICDFGVALLAVSFPLTVFSTIYKPNPFLICSSNHEQTHHFQSNFQIFHIFSLFLLVKDVAGCRCCQPRIRRKANHTFGFVGQFQLTQHFRLAEYRRFGVYFPIKSTASRPNQKTLCFGEISSKYGHN